ncbi:hypothetical protein B6U74_04745 [Candidatus Bathyarchaeota archaeon ex4484_205]|nr:MAG: hypothetical protein B6U74_04745 [Candidatus Bathyarchaeota archaeon ex4484_205]HDN17734.1 hypothetical protein [Candidatus Bathyarchaeota archaeon]
MNPQVGRLAFNLGVLIVFLSIIPLLYSIPIDSAEFIVDIIALFTGIIFLIVVAILVRREAVGGK